ncbi:hypothetical protein DVA86_10080 [Streptomyces armeniacus]|uniref:M23ase beta-sheet core domain-containing protein n=1 Tax=Streptomyces armeniacus TaxID=83291 RepID=A0A345XMT1_9ACTN|nr:hypothetical protein DVA86_10080 [Streptomyces armeniacus]
MNDPHPSGNSFPADPAADFSYSAYDTGSYVQAPYGTTYETGGYPVTGYDGYATGAFSDLAAVAYGDGDPLFGSLPDAQGAGAYDTGAYPAGTYPGDAYAMGAYATGTYDETGAYATGQYANGAYDSGSYPVTGYDTGGYDTGGYDSALWSETGYPAAGAIPQQYHPEQSDYGAPATADATGHWDASAYAAPQWDSGAYDAYETGGYDTGGYENAALYETGGHDSTSWGTATFDTGEGAAYGRPEYDGAAYGQHPYEHEPFTEQPFTEQPFTEQPFTEQPYDERPYDEHAAQAPDANGFDPEPEQGPADAEHPDAEPVLTPAAPLAGSPSGRGRRRSPRPRRSALLTVAAPSVAVLGVAGIAAASVTGVSGDSGDGEGGETTTQASPDREVKPTPANNKLDTQLAGLSADADDFADRASRTQERIDLKKRKAEERERKAAEAARKEAMRPKFAAPVEGTGISAQYGQAGVNWMSVHSGIDFPASYGTAVKAATDGTVTTKWGGSYGNMAIVTAEDGTETWYCHLSSTKIRSGSVKAGDVIAYSGNSGNSTGPHLHFEVRPGGGSAVDPMPWFRSHGIEPG